MKKIKLNENGLRKLVKSILSESGPFYSDDPMVASMQRDRIERGPASMSLDWTEEAIELAERDDVNGLNDLFHKELGNKIFPNTKWEEKTEIGLEMFNELLDTADAKGASYDAVQLLRSEWGSVFGAYWKD